MPNKPASIEIVEDKEGRFVLTTFADGTVERTPVDPKSKPKRRRFRPLQRAKAERMNHTRKKRF